MNLLKFDTIEELTFDVAKEVLRIGELAIEDKGLFIIALSGGETPKKMFSYFGTKFKQHPIWKNTVVFFVDDRCVSVNHKENNFIYADSLFFEHVPIPKKNIFKMDTENQYPELGAYAYAKDMKAFFERNDLLKGEKFPSFDLITLGLGLDGHTASLFPNALAVEEKKLWITNTPAPTTSRPNLPRLTMTFPVLNAAKNIIFMISGKEKQSLLNEIINHNNEKYPASKVNNDDVISWYICNP